MSSGQKSRLKDIEPVAQKIRERLKPYCGKIEIAGSIRRQKPMCGDIELVLIPRMELVKPAEPDQIGMFETKPGKPAVYNNLLNSYLDTLVDQGAIEKGRAWGDRYRAFDLVTVGSGRRYQVDVWQCRPENWGNTFWIRTGSHEFNMKVVQLINHVGLKHEKGRLLRDGEPIDCFSEQGFFEAIGLDYVEPAERTQRTAAMLKAKGVAL